jgi:DNA-directed RNA polymerase specialized sigma24 family protein
MQPPTEPTTAILRGDEAELFCRHHRDLQRAVAHAVNAPREVIEDACQNAWTIMLRAQPDRPSIFGWLYVVAIREAFRLCERDRRHLHLEAISPTWDAVISDAFSIDDILEARAALQILASLPDRQRADLTLLVAGYTYQEILSRAPGRTYTNLNKSFVKSRRRIRDARAADNRRTRPAHEIRGGQDRRSALLKGEMPNPALPRRTG